MALEQHQIDEISRYDEEKRLKYSVKTMVQERQIWILTDEHGCVMLNTEDEDCVPVWPNQEFAEQWATGEWDNCKAEAISLNKWHSRWTHGLEDDELAWLYSRIKTRKEWCYSLTSLILSLKSRPVKRAENWHQ